MPNNLKQSAILHHTACLCFIIALSGCGGAGKSVETPSSEDAQGTPGKPRTKGDLETLMAREFSPLKETDITAPGNDWEATIEARGKPLSNRQDDYTLITAFLGTESPLVCFVYNNVIDPGSAAAAILENLGEKAAIETARLTDVRVVDNTGVLFVESLYTFDKEGPKVAGNLKVSIFAHSDHPALCMHDEVGYSQTFQRISLKFFKSITLTGRDQSVSPSYASVWIVRMDDIPVGYFREGLIKNEDGSEVFFDYNSGLVPRSAKELVASDDATVVFSDPKGHIVEGQWIKSEAGNITTNIVIERVKRNRYTYKGIYQGNRIKGRFKSKDKRGLTSEIGTIRRVREMIRNGTNGRFKAQEYHPGIDPSKLTVTNYKVHVENSIGRVTIESGQMKMSVTTDENGLYNHIELPLGGRKVTMGRLFVRGSP